MILRNYDNYVAWQMGNPDTSKSQDELVFGDGYMTVKNRSGRVYNIYRQNQYLPFGLFMESAITEATSSGSSNIVCGSGSTPEHYDDYKLEAPFTNTQVTSVQGVSISEKPLYDKDTNTLTYSYTRNYRANEDITIREIGVLYYALNSDVILVYRKVLETPLEVTTGNQFSLTFTSVVSLNGNKPADYSVSASA